MQTIRILIADDQPLVRAGIAALLAAQPGIVVAATAEAGPGAAEAAARHRPDVLLLDLPPAADDKIDLIGRLVTDTACHRAGHPVRVLPMTADYSPERAWQAMRAGAAGFLLKSRPPETLIGAVRTVAEAGVWLDPVVLRDMLVELAWRPAGGRSPSRLVARLTAREREVLMLLAYGLGSVEIAERLFLSQGTVRTHIGRILMKLECPDRTRAVVVAYRSGLVRTGAAAA
ncbi:LuxR C-terminal-related transcriptional regulator [Actinoplanes sp. NPDC000266]